MMWLPLTIGQERSIRLVDDALVDVSDQRIIGLVTSQDPEVEEPNPDQIYRTGTAAIVHRMLRAPDGTIRLIVQGIERIHVDEYLQEQPYLRARVSEMPDEEDAPDLREQDLEAEALMRATLDLFRRLVSLVPHMPEELETAAMNATSAKQLAYLVAASTRMEPRQAQEILELNPVSEKLVRLNSILSKELEVLELGRKIQSQAQDEMQKTQREYFLREQLKAIQKELGEGDEQEAEIQDYERRIAEAGMPAEAEKEARRELDRMRKMPSQAAEYTVIKTYLDWMVNLPWSVSTPDNLDIAHARQVLDEDHYGLEEIKDRILEFLAVRKLRMERKAEAEAAAGDNTNGNKQDDHLVDHIRREREGVILCFVGPPGTGKTSLGQSIARAMGRKFIRMALGGVRDEAEIRGFRRTYIGSMPGRIVQNIRRAESRNPVFILDEVDKLGHDFRGDPSSALLEVLDPEQNTEFRDHYLDVPFDLSQVFFITTANWMETIPQPLLDRMEIIQLSSYTEEEKVRIAAGYLVPRQVKENGLRGDEITFTDDALRRIVREYTREAGVRSLERQIGRVARKVATRVAEKGPQVGPVEINADRVSDYLGRPKFLGEVAERVETPGVATGLAWTPVGGDVLFLEATRMPGSKGFTLTGQLGDVMKESAQAALSWVRNAAKKYDIPEDFFTKSDIHVHIPAGATPKDGPSAGVTMATALVSLLTGRPVRKDVGMTGEITLRGQVLPIGGVKEKVLAAHRYGLTTVILPKRNEGDLEDVPEAVRKQMTFLFAERVEEVIDAALSAEQVEEPLAEMPHDEVPAPETEPKPVAEVTVVES
jgi:ATP-dependent Lon protease